MTGARDQELVGGWAVSTPHGTASQAAERVFRVGGNAVDAALAAAAMLTVVYPNQCSLGGDLIALVGTPDGQVLAVNASGRAPAGLDSRAFARDHATMPVYGPHPVTVPGVVSGWEALHQRWGSKPFEELLADAYAAAADGVPVAAGLARDLVRESDRVFADSGLRSVFVRDGALLGPGAVLRQPQLARSLGLLRSQGPSVMYAGPLGERITRELRSRGSAMTMADLRDHRVEVSRGAGVEFAGTDYVTTGGNSQGTFFLAGLAALEQLRKRGSVIDMLGDSAGMIASILARAALQRDALLGDASGDARLRVSDALVDDLLSAGIHGTAPMLSPAARGDTAAVSTVDGDGLWVSLLQSVFHAFGSGILEPQTGIVLHNRGASFTLQDGARSQFVGGRRPPHTLMPVITKESGRISGCIAVMGGRAQPQIQTHIAAALASGAGLQDAVSRPRWILGALEAGRPAAVVHTARLEEDVPQNVADSLQRSGFEIERLGPLDDEAGHATAVRARFDESGRRVIEAAADPRADGTAIVGPPK